MSIYTSLSFLLLLLLPLLLLLSFLCRAAERLGCAWGVKPGLLLRFRHGRVAVNLKGAALDGTHGIVFVRVRCISG